MLENYTTNLSNEIFLQNSLATRWSAIWIFFLVLLFMWWFKKRCLRWLVKYSKYTQTTCDDFIIDSFDSLPHSFFAIVALYSASNFLTLGTTIESIIYVAFVVLAISQLWVTIWRVLLHILQNHYFEWEEWKHTISFLRMVVNVVVGAIVILMILNNLWVEITPLITSLGIAGVAVAFALKNILEDLFSSVSIFIDKPFIIGDYIEIWDASWSVTRIGIKTTRITTTRWEELVVSNRRLTNETIRNHWKMDHRTITENVTIPYWKDLTLLEKFPEKIKYFFDTLSESWVTLVRIYLTWLEENGTKFTYRYTIDSKNYTLYLEIQQRINIEILKILNENGSQIAPSLRRVIS